MNWYAIGFFSGSIFAFGLGIIVYLRNKSSFLNRIWCLQCFSVSAWQFGRCMVAVSLDRDSAFFWTRVLYLGAIFIPILTLHFILVLTEKPKEKKTLILLGYSFGLLELAGFNFSKLFVQDVIYNSSFGFYEVPGKFYLFHFLMLGFPTYAVWFLFKEHQRTSLALKKNQIKYVISASLLGFISGATSFFPFLDIKIPPIAAPFTSMYVFIISYAIIKYRLMDITVVIKKSVTYSFLILLLLTPCLLILLLSERAIFGSFDYIFSSILLLLFLLAAFAFPRLKVILENWGTKMLFRNEVACEDVFYKLSRKIVQVLDLDNLLSHIVDIIVKTMDVEKVSVFVLDNEENKFKIRASYGLNGEKDRLLFPKQDFFFRWVEEKNNIVIREEIEERIYSDQRMGLIDARMKEMGSEICLPLVHENHLIGIINLSYKKSRSLFSYKDIELLKALSNQASVALENARLYDMLKRSKIHMRRVDRLASLGTLTAGLAHEIRNPLVSIKTFLQLLPERFDDEEFRTYFLNLTVEEVERISSLLSELLDFARPSEPNFQKADINEIMEKVVLLADKEISKKSLVVHKQYNIDLPKAVVDRAQMKQVFLNIFLNAIQASSERGEIFIETRFLDIGEKFVQVIVRDKGEGISEKDIENIFTPFFSIKSGGTGLGLSISHQIVQEHRGTINVKSRPGEGSTFTINLPLNSMDYKKRNELSPEEEVMEGTIR